MTSVTFVPRHVAERICGEFDFTISIMPPGEEAVIQGVCLKLYFDDTEMSCGGLKMFTVHMARQIVEIDAQVCDEYRDQRILVHCEAGMSRSAAVAKWLADNFGYDLWLHPDGVGTAAHYNRHVYRTLDAAIGKDMAAYYEELERNERMMGQ